MLKHNKNAAAIASQRAADFYEGNTKKSNIEDNPNNATRFIVYHRLITFLQNMTKPPLLFHLMKIPPDYSI
ncbi:MAG: hypothetical protein CM1200mP37_8900 [Chloroflexota bacterium]|nr:MAG: hypothetical protein CM1200mP37_8900 [Chloroflexota bacterium]